ncbi:MAG: hypothetical protein AAB341_04225 [Planctomycetota bacterium]
MRKLLAGVVIVAFAIGFYAYRHGGASTKVKSEMLRLVDDLNLSPEQHEAARRMVELHHEAAYGDALDISRDRGQKFDARLYQEVLFRRIIDQARQDGDADLADRLSAQRNDIQLVVTEQ